MAEDMEINAEIMKMILQNRQMEVDVQRSMQAGLNAHLSKPVQPDDLFETLESLIED